MLAKTVKAREALEAGKAGAVDLRDRRILILADGRRTRAELVTMLGAGYATSIDRLMHDGYLWQVDGTPPNWPRSSNACNAIVCTWSATSSTCGGSLAGARTGAHRSSA